MQTFTQPNPLHGAALASELGAAGFPDVEFYADGQGQLTVDVAETDRAAVQQVLDGHTGEPPPPTDAEAARQRLAELYAKGWANLTAQEKGEVPKLVVELVGAS